MFKGLAAVFFVLLTVLSAAASPLKVVCWNLQWFPGGKPEARQAEKKKHMKAAQEALRTLNPDILCVQEVKDWKAVQELVSVVPGLQVAVVSRFPGDQQQGIASKLTPDSSWAEEWNSKTVTDIPRGYSFAALRMPQGGFLLVYSVHLKANGRDPLAANIAKREESSRQLYVHAKAMVELYGQRGPVGVLIAGDWNTTLDENPDFNAERTIRSLLEYGFESSWEGVPFELRITHPGSGGWPSITFDHVLSYGVKVAGASVVPISGVSDHMPVVLSVEGLQPTAPIAEVPLAPAPTEVAPEPTPAQPTGVTMEVEGGSGFQVREITIAPPTFDPGTPGVPKPKSKQVTTP